MAETFPDLNRMGSILSDEPSGSTSEKNFSKENLNYSETPNLICDRYEINTSYELKDYSNDFVEVFPANDIFVKDRDNSDSTVLPGQKTEPSKELFAYAYKRNTPIPINEIISLCKKNSDNINLPIAYGICPLGTSEEEKFIVIIPKQQGKSLREVLNTKISLDDKFIKTKLLPQILKAFEVLHSLKIAHGSINPNNIFFDKNGNLILKESISEPSGYSQIPLYETVERAQCTNIAKGQAEIEDDYYALGVLLFFLISNKEFEHLDTQDMLREKLFHGTAHFLNAAQNIPSVLGELIKGLVFDSASSRFSNDEVDNVINGKPVYFNAVDKSYLSRAIIFNGKEHHSKKSLAYDLFINWEKAKEYVKGDKIQKWLDSSLNEEQTLDALNTLSIPSLSKSSIGSVLSKDDELLIKALIILDPYGPIRVKHLCFNIEGIGQLLCNSINHSQTNITQLLASLIFNNIFSLFDFLKITFPKVNKNKTLVTLDECSTYIKKGEFGFGLERCLYDLNPTLICQSHILQKKFCIDLTHLLDTLDKSEISFEDLVSKKTLSAFIGSRINLKKEIENNEIMSFPVLRKSRSYQLLGIFTVAQKLTPLNSLVNLAKTINNSIVDVLEVTLKSRKYKRLFFNQLNMAAESGCIKDLHQIAIKSPYLNEDSSGYASAIKRGATISAEIFSYGNRKLMEQKARRHSLGLAVKFSYIVCSILIILIFFRGF